MKKLLTIIVLLLSWSAAAHAAEPAQYLEDEHGHRFRTSFDRHNRTEVETGYRVDTDTGGTTIGLSHRGALSWDFPDEEIWWRLRHRLAHVSAMERRAGWDLRLVLFDADYLRHDVSSWILIPGDSNLRIPGPFDIVVRWEIGGATISTEQTDFVKRWEVIELDFLLDFIRDPDYRHRLAIGVSADYEIRDEEMHELTPLSGVTALYGWENQRGTFAVHAEGRYDRWVALSAGATPSWRNRIRAGGRVEWTPIAINDQPLAFYARSEFVSTEGADDEATFTAGLRLAIQGN